jgi:hypothetical protein
MRHFYGAIVLALTSCVPALCLSANYKDWAEVESELKLSGAAHPARAAAKPVALLRR